MICLEPAVTYRSTRTINNNYYIAFIKKFLSVSFSSIVMLIFSPYLNPYGPSRALICFANVNRNRFYWILLKKITMPPTSRK